MSDKVELIAEEVRQLSPDGQKLIKAIVSGDISNLQADPETLQATTGLIINLTAQLDKLRAKKKEVCEICHNLFTNDTELSRLEPAMDEAKRLYNERKRAIAATALYVDMNVKIKDLAEDIKIVTESLNVHLLNYYQITGSRSFDVSESEEREYTIKARVNSGPKHKAGAPVVGQKDIFGGEAA